MVKLKFWGKTQICADNYCNEEISRNLFCADHTCTANGKCNGRAIKESKRINYCTECWNHVDKSGGVSYSDIS